MKKLIVGVIIFFTVLPLSCFANDALENLDRDKLIAIEAVKQQYESTFGHKTTSASEPLAKFWPTKPGSNAVSDTFYRGYGSSIAHFKIYIWREDGYTWMQIEPLDGDEPFICSSSFSIVQDGVQCDDVKLLPKSSSSSQCDDVYVTSIFKVTFWSFVENPPDLSQEFTLYYDGGEETFTLEWSPSGTSTSNNTYYIPYFNNGANSCSGLGLLNIDESSTASIHAITYDNDGVARDGELKNLEAGEQWAVAIGTEYSGEGWIKIESTTELAGLCFIGSLEPPNYMADIPVVSSKSESLMIPHAAQSSEWDTTIMVCNPNDSQSNVHIYFQTYDGYAVGEVSHLIPANGAAQIKLSEMTEGISYDSGSVLITSIQGIVAFALYDNFKSGGHCYVGISAIESD